MFVCKKIIWQLSGKSETPAAYIYIINKDNDIKTESARESTRDVEIHIFFYHPCSSGDNDSSSF